MYTQKEKKNAVAKLKSIVTKSKGDITSAYLANKMGISRANLSYWFNGIKTPSHDNTKMILDFLKTQTKKRK